MAWYPVKSGFGTRTTGGGLVSQPTGSFADLGAANVYNDVVAALSDGIAPGDTILASHLHAHDYGAIATYVGTSGSGGNEPVKILSVNDADMGALLAGASENATGEGDLVFQNDTYWHGFTQRSDDDFDFGSGAFVTWELCDLRREGVSDTFRTISTAVLLRLINTNITVENAASTGTGIFWLRSGSRVQWYGGALLGEQVGYLFAPSGFSSGGGHGDLYGVDLSVGFSTAMSASFNSNTIIGELRLKDCKLPAATPIVDDSANFFSPATVIEYINFAELKANQSGAFRFQSNEGTIENEPSTGIHRDESVALAGGGGKFSLKVITNSNCSIARPFRYNFAQAFSDISVNNKVRFRFVSTSALTDKQVYTRSVYADNAVVGKYKTATNNPDLLVAGTAHVDDSGSSAWKNGAADLTGYNEYRMDNILLDGDDGIPINFIEIAEPNITVYFDVIYDTVA